MSSANAFDSIKFPWHFLKSISVIIFRELVIQICCDCSGRNQRQKSVKLQARSLGPECYYWFDHNVIQVFAVLILTAVVALKLERLPREQEVMGLILGRDRPKSLKLEVVAFPLKLYSSSGFPPWHSGFWEQHYNWLASVRIMDWLNNGQK